MDKREYDWSKIVKTVKIYEEPEPSALLAKQQQPSFASGTMQLEVEQAPKKVSWIPDNMPVTKENLLKCLIVTEEQRCKIWSYDQRDPDWHKERAGRMTGSLTGSAAGHNPYCTPKKAVTDKLYAGSFDNFAMKWGRDNEDPARDTYKMIKERQHATKKQVIEFEKPPNYLDADYQQIDDVVPVDPDSISDAPYNIDIIVRGLIVHPTTCWFGYSPDGEVNETDDKGLLEIKCPRRMYDEVPWYYYDQIQFGMFNLGLKWCDFFVWRPDQTSLKRFAFNQDYWDHDLYPKLESWYMDLFLPEAINAIEKERSWDPSTAKVVKKLHL